MFVWAYAKRAATLKPNCSFIHLEKHGNHQTSKQWLIISERSGGSQVNYDEGIPVTILMQNWELRLSELNTKWLPNLRSFPAMHVAKNEGGGEVLTKIAKEIRCKITFVLGCHNQPHRRTLLCDRWGNKNHVHTKKNALEEFKWNKDEMKMNYNK